MKRKLLASLLVVAMTATMLTGCGGNNAANNAANEAATTETEETTEEVVEETTEEATEEVAEEETSAEPVTLKIFSNLPDRTTGQGLVEQTIIDEYMAENPNVTIEVEALADEEYKTKFKAYSMDGMPDVVSIWGQPAFLDEVLEAGVLAELNEADYADYQFISGSLEGFKKDGKLYGLPRNTDIMLFFYNAKMFEDNGWAVPTTYDELLALAGPINDAGIVPVAMNGGEGWPVAIYLTEMIAKIKGNADHASVISNAIANKDFSDPAYTQATQYLADAVSAGLFQPGYETQDGGTAKSLFTNGQAAMFYMGSWESSMALDDTIPEEIRNNIKVFTMPTVEGGVATATDISAWHGGGYAVAESSAVKEEAIKFLNYMYQPDKLSKYGWENGVGMSAQNQSAYMTGNETELQLQIMDILNNATSVSGTPINDCGPATFKTQMESTITSVSTGSTSIEDFLSGLAGSIE